MSNIYRQSRSFVPGGLVQGKADGESGRWQAVSKPPQVENSNSTTENNQKFNLDQLTSDNFSDEPDELITLQEEPLAQDSSEDKPSSSPQETTPPESPLVDHEESNIEINDLGTVEEQEDQVDIEALRLESFLAGKEEGRREAEEDYENTANTLISACTQVDRLKNTILNNSLDEMREIIFQICEKIIRHSVQEQSETIVATIEDAIRLAVKSDEFQIRLHPDDIEIVKNKKPELIAEISGLESLMLKPDLSVERGGCILESTHCMVDATLSSQLDAIRDELSSNCDQYQDSGD